MAQPSYADLVVGNIRAERNRRKLDQADVVERMRELGFTSWHRQTMSRIEKGDRRIFPEELLGLSLALEVPMATLLFPAAGDMRMVSMPGGQLVILPVRHEVPADSEKSVLWAGNKARFAAPQPAEQPIVAAIVTSAKGVLITRRNQPPPLWGFVAGEVEPGELPEDAAVREVKEETSLEVRVRETIGERDHPSTGRHMIYMAAKPVRSTKVIVGDEAELAEVKWASLDEAFTLLEGLYEPVRRYLEQEVR